jgi:drug/metabolite transporter (DMT)-like permease
MIIGAILIFYVFGISDHNAGLASVVAVIYLVFVGVFAWLLFHLRKMQAIKNASQIGPVEGNEPIN